MDSQPKTVAVPRGVLLWEQPPVSCTCRTLDTGHIEVTVAVDGIAVSTESFEDHTTASEYAIGKMHAHTPPSE